MTEKKNRKPKQKPLIERLPQLTEEHRERVVSEVYLRWVYRLLSRMPNDPYIDKSGIAIQVVSTSVARCIALPESPLNFQIIADMRETFEYLGLTFEIGEFTVLISEHKAKDDDFILEGAASAFESDSKAGKTGSSKAKMMVSEGPNPIEVV